MLGSSQATPGNRRVRWRPRCPVVARPIRRELVTSKAQHISVALFSLRVVETARHRPRLLSVDGLWDLSLSLLWWGPWGLLSLVSMSLLRTHEGLQNFSNQFYIDARRLYYSLCITPIKEHLNVWKGYLFAIASDLFLGLCAENPSKMKKIAGLHREKM